MRLLRTLSLAIVAALALGTVPGSAAPPPGGYNWTGFYAGAVGSGGLYTVEQEDYWCWWACNAPTLQDWDASIGLQGGYYGQNGNFVYGIVADINTGFENSASISYSSGNSAAVYAADWNYYATIRGRAGIAAGEALFFGTAGIAIVDVDYSAVGTDDFDNSGFVCSDTDVDCASHDGTEVGFAAGLGVGYPVGDNLHLTFEYLFIGLPWQNDRYDTDEENEPDDTDDYVSWTTSAHLARVALVWEFN